MKVASKHLHAQVYSCSSCEYFNGLPPKSPVLIFHKILFVYSWMTRGACFNILQANLKAQSFIVKSSLKLDNKILLFAATNFSL